MAAPTDDDLHTPLQTLITRLMKLVARRGVLVEDMGQTYLAESDADADADGDEARTLRPVQAAALSYRIAFGPRAGQRVLTFRGAMPREGTAGEPVCADIDGFSLHTAVRVEDRRAAGRQRLQQRTLRPGGRHPQFDTLDQAIAEANRLPFGLAGYALTRSIRNPHQLA